MKNSALRYYLHSITTLARELRNPLVMARLLLGGASRKAVKVQLRNGVVFQLFSALDLWVLKETILDRQYETVSLALQDGWTVVDIGAALGDYSVWAASQTPHGRIVAVEPFAPAVEILRSNLAENHITNVQVFAGAIAAEDGEMTLKVNQGHLVQNSLIVGGDGSEVHQVPTLSLHGLFTKFKIDHCDYLKMDCEGGEYDILFAAPADTLAKINRICMEVHDGMTSHNRDEMDAFLEKAGFQVKITPNPVHENLAYLYAAR